jgi:hypothetical protein
VGLVALASSRDAEIEKRRRDLGSGILAESFGGEDLLLPPTPLNIGSRWASQARRRQTLTK